MVAGKGGSMGRPFSLAERLTRPARCGSIRGSCSLPRTRPSEAGRSRHTNGRGYAELVPEWCAQAPQRALTSMGQMHWSGLRSGVSVEITPLVFRARRD